MRLGVDLMGSERDPHEFFSAVEEMERRLLPSDNLVVFATEEVLNDLPRSPRITPYTVTEVIEAHDDPLTAVRRKKGASLIAGVRLIHTKALDAFVSPGNTGALIAACTLTLSMYGGIKRPPLLASLPKKNGLLSIVDVGGLVSCTAEQMVQFAWMGAAFQRVMHNKAHPSIGLLNIGQETGKGTIEIRKAHKLLQEMAERHACHFFGNVEGREVFQSPIDVLVTDGFTGNVFLKTTEGLSAYIFDDIYRRLEKESSQGMMDKIETWRQQFNHSNYPGALLCGVEGLIMKCHGSSTSQGMLSSLKAAHHLMHFDLVQKMKQELS